jgi:CheY-like chemotaxis protein
MITEAKLCGRYNYAALPLPAYCVTYMSTRLLIVDDLPGARELIRNFLTMPGVTFEECDSGDAAVARVRDFKPHWVTMDIKMPGLDGFETTKAIKLAYPEARVMIVTSFNDPHFRDLAHSAGAAGFILKENLLALRLMLEKETKNIRSSQSAAANLTPSAEPAARRVLIVDDDKELHTFTEQALVGAGFQVTRVHNGLEAIALHRRNPLDVVIIELLLPGNDGFETLAELRRMASPPKFIATAKASWMPVQVYSRMAKQLGVHGTLAKPFSSEQLLAAVQAILDS